jgi:ribosomal protein S18 acetylase RimI-like enzyme
MSAQAEVRIVDVDGELTDHLLRYAVAHGAEHDDSYAGEGEFAAFDSAGEPAAVALDDEGDLLGAASVMLDGYAGEGLARFRILHATDPAIYPSLIEHMLARLPDEVGRVFLFLPEDAGPVEDALSSAGFVISRRAYILDHTDPANVHVPEPSEDTRLVPALATAAGDWAHIVNAAFHGEPGRYDVTVERAHELLSRPRVIREATLIAWRGGMPAGLVLTVADDERPYAAEIETLAVAPAHQGIGLGTLLMRSAVHAAAEHGRRRVSLSVSASNRRALPIYLDAGFNVEDVRVCWQLDRRG